MVNRKQSSNLGEQVSRWQLNICRLPTANLSLYDYIKLGFQFLHEELFQDYISTSMDSIHSMLSFISYFYFCRGKPFNALSICLLSERETKCDSISCSAMHASRMIFIENKRIKHTLLHKQYHPCLAICEGIARKTKIYVTTFMMEGLFACQRLQKADQFNLLSE